MKTSIQSIPTSKPYIFKILLHLNKQVKQIAILDTTGEGTLHISRNSNHLFRKTNSIGMNYELLHASSIKFKHIQISYNGKEYYSTREYYLSKGVVPPPFKNYEIQAYVPLENLNKNEVKRFEYSLLIQEDFFKQVA